MRLRRSRYRNLGGFGRLGKKDDTSEIGANEARTMERGRRERVLLFLMIVFWKLVWRRAFNFCACRHSAGRIS